MSNKYQVHKAIRVMFWYHILIGLILNDCSENEFKVTDMSDMSLEVFQPEGAHDEPELQRPKTPAQRNLPVLDDRKE